MPIGTKGADHDRTANPSGDFRRAVRRHGRTRNFGAAPPIAAGKAPALVHQLGDCPHRFGDRAAAVQDRGRWQLRIQNVNEPERTLSLGAGWELKRVSVAMRLRDAGKEREVELMTLRLVRKKDS